MKKFLEKTNTSRPQKIFSTIAGFLMFSIFTNNSMASAPFDDFARHLNPTQNSTAKAEQKIKSDPEIEKPINEIMAEVSEESLDKAAKEAIGKKNIKTMDPITASVKIQARVYREFINNLIKKHGKPDQESINTLFCEAVGNTIYQEQIDFLMNNKRFKPDQEGINQMFLNALISDCCKDQMSFLLSRGLRPDQNGVNLTFNTAYRFTTYRDVVRLLTMNRLRPDQNFINHIIINLFATMKLDDLDFFMKKGFKPDQECINKMFADATLRAPYKQKLDFMAAHNLKPSKDFISKLYLIALGHTSSQEPLETILQQGLKPNIKGANKIFANFLEKITPHGKRLQSILIAGIRPDQECINELYFSSLNVDNAKERIEFLSENGLELCESKFEEFSSKILSLGQADVADTFFAKYLPQSLPNAKPSSGIDNKTIDMVLRSKDRNTIINAMIKKGLWPEKEESADDNQSTCHKPIYDQHYVNSLFFELLDNIDTQSQEQQANIKEKTSLLIQSGITPDCNWLMAALSDKYEFGAGLQVTAYYKAKVETLFGCGITTGQKWFEDALTDTLLYANISNGVYQYLQDSLNFFMGKGLKLSQENINRLFSGFITDGNYKGIITFLLSKGFKPDQWVVNNTLNGALMFDSYQDQVKFLLASNLKPDQVGVDSMFYSSLIFTNAQEQIKFFIKEGIIPSEGCKQQMLNQAGEWGANGEGLLNFLNFAFTKMAPKAEAEKAGTKKEQKLKASSFQIRTLSPIHTLLGGNSDYKNADYNAPIQKTAYNKEPESQQNRWQDKVKMSQIIGKMSACKTKAIAASSSKPPLKSDTPLRHESSDKGNWVALGRKGKSTHKKYTEANHPQEDHSQANPYDLLCDEETTAGPDTPSPANSTPANTAPQTTLGAITPDKSWKSKSWADWSDSDSE